MSNTRCMNKDWQKEFAKEWDAMCKFVKESSKEAGIDLNHIKIAYKDKMAEYKYM